MAGGLINGGTSGIGGLIYGNPDYNTAPIDPGTQDLINRQVGQATSSSPEDYAAKDMAGTSGHVDTGATQNFATALGGPQDSNMKAALDSRAQRYMAGNLNQLQRQAHVEGQKQHTAQLQNAFGDVTAAQTAMNQANQASIQAEQNNIATRNSIISGIFGSAGSVAGFMGGGNQVPKSSPNPNGIAGGGGGQFGQSTQYPGQF